MARKVYSGRHVPSSFHRLEHFIVSISGALAENAICDAGTVSVPEE
jgi:hypothetical protein